MNFDEEQVYQFWGTFEPYFKLNDQVYIAKEDESDGYRSYCDDIELVEEVPDYVIWLPISIDVKVRESLADDFEGIEIYRPEEPTGYLAKIGTERTDRYYPYYYFYG